MSAPTINPNPLAGENSSVGQLHRLNELLRTVREVGRILNREKDLPSLLQQICDALVKNRGFVAVWIGQPDPHSPQIIPLAGNGETIEFLRQADIRWDNSSHGQGPAGTAIRTLQPEFLDNIQDHPRFAPWRNHAAALGANSVGSYPLLFQGHLTGVITLKSRLPLAGAFNTEESELLAELAADVARAWQGIEDEKALRQAEKSNREAGEFYLKLLQTAPVLMWRSGLDSRCNWFNDSWLQFTGRTLQQECGEGWMEGVHPDDLANLLRGYHKAFQEQQPFDLEYRLRCHDGEYHWVTDHGRTLIALNGEFTGYIGFCHDVHYQRLALQNLREVEHRQRAILDNIPDPMWLKDLSGRYLAVNPAWQEFSGLSPEKILGRTHFELFPPESARIIQKNDDWVIQYRRPLKREEQFKLPGGQVVWFETFNGPLVDTRGQVIGTVGIVRNIDQRKQAELELARAKQDLERINQDLEQRVIERTEQLEGRDEEHLRLIANMTAGIACFSLLRDDSGKVTDLQVRFVNPAFEKITGLTGIAGKKLGEFPPTLLPEQSELIQGMNWVAVTGQPLRLEVQSAENAAWLSVNAFRNTANEIVCLFEDITERKHHESALQASAEHLQKIIQMAPIPLCYFDERGEFKNFNQRFLALFGYADNARPTAAEWWQTAIPEPDERLNFQMEQFHSKGGARHPNSNIYPQEYRMRRRDGAIRHVEISCAEIENGLLTVYVDNTENRLIQEVLRESEERWQFALAGADDGVWDWDISSQKVIYTRRWKEMLGYQEHEIGDSVEEWSRRVHPEDLPLIQSCLAEHMAGRSASYRAEHRLLCKDGSYKWILTRGKVMKRDAAGQPMRIIGTHTDITIDKATEEALRASLSQQRMLAEVVETSAMPFAIGQANGSLQMVNRAFELLTGYSRAAIIQKVNWLKTLTPPEYHAAEIQLLEKSLADRQPFNFEKEFIRADGSRVPIELLVQPIYDEAGNYLHFRAFFKDISERKKSARELEAAMARVNLASQAKTEFLASMSHEIRTPLNAILGYTQILQREPDVHPATRQKLDIINRSGENLLQILNDILDLAKIEAGQMQLLPVEFNLPQLLQDQARLFKPLAAQKDLAFHLVLPEDLPSIVCADEAKLRQILLNLLGNATKFTERGSIELRVSLSRSNPNRPELCLLVTDTGPGITAEEETKLFKKFQQAKAGREAFKGIGLGLAISRQFARLMGGEITLTSTPGSGSCFQISLPVGLPSQPASTEQRAGPARFLLPPGTPPILVLVVDDVPENRDVLFHLLNDVGFLVETVDGGAAALTACRAATPRLVLMDTRMPDMDGYETIRRLRGEFPHANLKIISVSAAAYASDQADAKLAGADDFIAKPINADELFGKISHLLGLGQCLAIGADLESDHSWVEAPQNALAPEILATLPAIWRSELREALALADFQQVNQLLDQLEKSHPATANALHHLADQFDADALLRLFPAPS